MAWLCNLPLKLFDDYIDKPLRKQKMMEDVKTRLLVECSDNCASLYIVDMEKLCDCALDNSYIMIARDTRMQEQVAVKIVSTDFEKNLVTVENEVRIMQDCYHPNLVELYECFYHPEAIWIEMEYCSRGSLGRMIRSGVRFSEQHIASIVKHVLRGIHYLHYDRLVMHNDIKSDNILVNELYQIKICDFGLSRELRNHDQKRRTEAGTLHYLAPEQCEMGEKRPCYGIEADIWSLGIVVYEMATGNKPHSGCEKHEIRRMIIESPAPQLEFDKWSGQFRDFVSKMLQKDPTLRWSAAQLIDHPFLLLNGNLEPSEFLPSYERTDQLVTHVQNSDIIIDTPPSPATKVTTDTFE